MAQLTAGKKAAETNKKRHGADFYKRIGSKGGKKGTGHEFAHGKIKPMEAYKLRGKNK